MFKTLCLFSALVMSANLVIGYHASRDDRGSAEIEKLTKVLQLVRTNYVDSDEKRLGYEPLIRDALNGMLHGLDRHSAYLPPAETSYMTDSTEGNFAGIGIVIDPFKDPVTVYETIPGSPAIEAGMQAGDHIRQVGNMRTADKSVSEILDKVKGEVGTEVALMVYRPELDKEIPITVRRDIIETPAVRERGHYLDNQILHILISSFSKTTTKDLYRLIRKQKNLKGIILDVRFNPGGLLTTARSSCELFLPPGAPIVKIVPREKDAAEVMQSRNGPRQKSLNLPIVILMNGGSASGAEILAGCLRDNGIALLVGEKTFGKASVQTIFPLVDGSSIKLTTAHYYTPSEKPIHNVGIKPDIKVSLPYRGKDMELFRMQLYRFNYEEQADDLADPQLERALEEMKKILEKRKVSP